MASQCQQGSGCHITGIRAKGNGFHHVSGTANTAAHHQGNPISDSLFAQAAVHCGQRQLNGNPHIVTDSGGSRTGAAPESINRDDICAAAGNTAGNGCNIVNGGHLDNHRLFIFGCFLQGENQLTQVLNGVNIMVGCRRNGIRAFGNHSGPGNVPDNFRTGQMAADAGLCALTHFDFHRSACFQIFLIHAETAGSYLYNGVGAIDIKVLMEAALTGIVEDSQLRGRPGQAGVGVIADGTVAHGGKHHRHGQFQLGRELTSQISVFVPLHLFRLLSQKHPGFHGFPQRIDRRVGHLGCVDQNFIPIYRQRSGVAHGRKEHTAALGLLVNLSDGIILPVGIFPQGTVALHNFQRPGGTQGHAPLAVDTFTLIAEHHIAIRIITVYLIGTLAFTDTALDAAVFISDDFKLGIKQFHQKHPSFTLTMTGSPPAGA